MNQLCKILLLLLMFNLKIFAQQYTEYELKSAYLFNFAKFVEFPESTFSSSKDPFIIGVYGNESFLDILQNIIKGRTINNRNVIAISITQPSEMLNCQIIFFSKLSPTEVTMLLEFIGNRPILTVADNIEDFCQNGGMINFLPQHSQKRFEINPNAAQRAKISISSKLLILSRIVNDKDVKF